MTWNTSPLPYEDTSKPKNYCLHHGKELEVFVTQEFSKPMKYCMQISKYIQENFERGFYMDLNTETIEGQGIIIRLVTASNEITQQIYNYFYNLNRELFF